MQTTYMDAKCINLILQLLNTSDFISTQKLSEKMNISQRSMYYYMCRINKWLSENDIPELAVVRNKGILIDEQTKKKIWACLGEQDTENGYIYSPTERVQIFICSIIASKEPVLVDTLADYCRVSRNSVFNDLKVVKNQLMKYGLQLDYQQKKGYSIKGNEINIRVFYLQTYRKLKAVFTRESLRFIDWGRVEYNDEILRKLEKELKVEFTSDTREALAILIPILEQNRGNLQLENVRIEDIQRKKEFQSVERHFPHLDFKEKIYLCLYLLGGRLANTSEDILEDVENEQIYEITRSLVTEFEKKACVQFEEKHELERQLFMHIKTSVYRYQFGIQSLDFMNEDIQKEYPDLFAITRIVSKYLENQIGMPISDSEVSYLALHFGAHLPVSACTNGKTRVLVVCANGISTGNMLRREILRLFPKAEVVGVQSSDRLVNPQIQCDFIVSTLKFASVVPVIVVHPILTAQDRKLLAGYLGEQDEASRIRSDELVDILRPFIKEGNMDDAKNGIDRYLAKFRNPADKMYLDKNKKGLLDIITSDRVEIHNEKYIWTKAIWRSAARLLEIRSVEPQYIDNIIEQLRYYGNYMFIMDGVLLAHTKTEFGAKKLDCEIHFFKQPIPFSGQDKARVIITLSAIDNESHLKLLKDLLTIFQNETAIASIMACTTKIEILEAFESLLANAQ